jgi:hypothetical protein
VLRSGDEPVTMGLEPVTSADGDSDAGGPDEEGAAPGGVEDAAGPAPAEDAGEVGDALAAMVLVLEPDPEPLPDAPEPLPDECEPLPDEPEPLPLDPEPPEDAEPPPSLLLSWLSPLCSSCGLPPSWPLSRNSRACPGARARACWAAMGQFSWVLGW